MNSDHQIYPVKKGDSLESIAEKFGISVAGLKKYHNAFCELKELIGNDLANVQNIILPPKEKLSELKKSRDQLKNWAQLPPPYLSKNFYASMYEVTEKFEYINKENFSVEYQLSLHLAHKLDQKIKTEVIASDFKKKGAYPDDKISMVSQACIESIYPIELLISEQGSIVDLYQHNAWVKKFEGKKQELESIFDGDINKAFIENFHASIGNADQLLHQFHSSFLYQILFPKLDWLRRKYEWKKEFYITQNSISVNGLFRTDHHFEDAQNVVTVISGTFKENYSLREWLKKTKLEDNEEEYNECESEEHFSGAIEIKYTTDKKTKQLKKIEAFTTIFYKSEIFRKHSIIIETKKGKLRNQNSILNNSFNLN